MVMTLRGGWGEGDIREEGLMHVMMETRATQSYIIARCKSFEMAETAFRR